MDIQALIAAAKVEGGEQAFAGLVAQHVTDEATKQASAATSRAEAAEAEAKRHEAAHKEILDEWKPVKSAIQASGFSWKDPDGIGAALKKGPTRDVMDMAQQMAESLAEKMTGQHAERAGTLEAEKSDLEQKLADSHKRADGTALRLAVREAEIGEGRPVLLDGLRGAFIRDKVAPFASFEDVPQADGSSERTLKFKHGGVNIINGSGAPATADDIVAMAYEQSGKHPWDTGTRDYFDSEGTGFSARKGGPSTPGASAGEKLDKATTIAEVAEAVAA